jgi:phosphatidylglycerophosphate synthase
MFLYFLSAFLDAFDGMAARAFNQESKVGGE